MILLAVYRRSLSLRTSRPSRRSFFTLSNTCASCAFTAFPRIAPMLLTLSLRAWSRSPGFLVSLCHEVNVCETCSLQCHFCQSLISTYFLLEQFTMKYLNRNQTIQCDPVTGTTKQMNSKLLRLLCSLLVGKRTSRVTDR